MRPRERRETGEQDLFRFRARLDQIIDMKHPLVTLGRTVDWGFLEAWRGASARSTRTAPASRRCRRD
jgi:transposase, IS5 family